MSYNIVSLLLYFKAVKKELPDRDRGGTKIITNYDSVSYENEIL